MDISTSTSLPLGLAKSPAGLGISGSGSFQSHLSTGESHSRLRAGIHPSPGKELLQYNVHHKSNSADMSNTPGSNRLAAGMSNRLSAEIGLENHASSRLLLSWPRTWLQWVFVVYCCLSVIFFTTAMFNHPERFHHLLSSPDISILSPLAYMTNQQRLSIISSIHPQPIGFEPYLLSGNVHSSGTSACLWSQDKDLDVFPEWASQWAGPISLLVTTTVMPSSIPHQLLLKKLSNLKSHLPLEIFQALSLHVLHITPNSRESPNAYLNLARLFARTDLVMLFPGNLSMVPPPTTLKTYSSQPQYGSTHLSVMSNQNSTKFPFPTLAPAFMPKDHPVWCTERFFFSSSRDFGWDACLWQLWLDSFGDVKPLQIPEWTDRQPVALAMNSALNKLRQRLSSKYRAETCVLAGKRLDALRITNNEGGRGMSMAAWLKSVCEKVI